MSDHFVSLNRGQTGTKANDFTIGASTSGKDIELRIADGAGLTRKDITLALEAFELWVQNYGLQNLPVTI